MPGRDKVEGGVKKRLIELLCLEDHEMQVKEGYYSRQVWKINSSPLDCVTEKKRALINTVFLDGVPGWHSHHTRLNEIY